MFGSSATAILNHLPLSKLSLDFAAPINLMAWLAIMPLSSIIQSVIFVYLIVKFQYGGGFNRIQKASVKSKDVKVKWDDVIGMDHIFTASSHNRDACVALNRPTHRSTGNAAAIGRF